MEAPLVETNAEQKVLKNQSVLKKQNKYVAS